MFFKLPKFGFGEGPKAPERMTSGQGEKSSEKEAALDMFAKAPRWKVRALEALRRLKGIRGKENPSVCIVYPVDEETHTANVAAEEVFEGSQITYVTKTRATREMLEERGYEGAMKARAEKLDLPEDADILIVMDSSVAITKKLLSNVKRGAHILVPFAKASAVRGTGNYECKGILDAANAAPSVKQVGEDFWEEQEVSTDAELKEASSKIDSEEEVVTYEEAAKIVKEKLGTVHNVIAQYRQLLKSPEGKDMKALPLKHMEVPEENLVVFKKKETV